mmetsp:Transcript_88281/g.229003  ORF Transcript_88281/g.229003 Transcript_88281/m.229003 type:complete len:94 (-) Transcript_88281:36-317(-)
MPYLLVCLGGLKLYLHARNAEFVTPVVCSFEADPSFLLCLRSCARVQLSGGIREDALFLDSVSFVLALIEPGADLSQVVPCNRCIQTAMLLKM